MPEPTPAHDANDPSPTGHPWFGYLCLAASMTMVGISVALAKPLMAAFPMFLLALARFGIAIVVLVPLVRSVPKPGRLTPRVHTLLFLLAFVGNYLFSLAMLQGVAQTSAVAGGIVMAALPAAVALLARWTLAERLEARVLGGIACAVAGVGLVAVSKGGAVGGSWGFAWLVAALFCEASYTVIAKRVAADIAAGRIALITSLWGFVLALPLGLWQARSFDIGGVTWADWALLLAYALMASVFSVWLWMMGVRHVSAARAGVFTTMVPVSSALVGVVALGEGLSVLQAGALALAVCGIVLAAGGPAPSVQAKPAGAQGAS